MTTNDFETESSRLIEWLTQRGVKISPKVGLSDYRTENQGRGMIAKQDIANGEVLFSIPLKSLLSVRNSPAVAALAEKYELEPWPALISLMLISASDPEWAPYFSVLPEFLNTPMFWGKEQLERLKGSFLVDDIGKDAAEEMYKEMHQGVLTDPLFKSVDTSIEAFHRMGSLIMAYGFDVSTTGDPEDSYVSMVPLADMLNSHSKLKNARLEMPDDEDGDLEMRATDDIPEGAQVYNTYGDLSNHALLRRYGYVEVGGTGTEVAELTIDDLLAALIEVEGITESEAAERWDQAVDKAEELEADFELEDVFVIENDGSPTQDLIYAANALSAPCDQSDPAKIIEYSENDSMFQDARDLFIAAVKAEISGHGAVEEPPKTSSSIYTEWKDMVDQVKISEVEILKKALQWAEGVTVIRPKKRKLEDQ